MTNEMDFWGHLGELRKRLIYSVVSVTIGAVLCYTYAGIIMDFLAAPYRIAFPNDPLIGTGPAEAFLLKLKLCFFAGILLSLPVLFYQLWCFIEPGLYPNEKRMMLPFVFMTTVLFLLGVWGCYTYVLPLAFDFFKAQYDSVNLSPTIKISEHLSLTLKALLGFGIAFELPALSFLLAKLGLITHKTLLKGFRAAVVLSFVAAAILTPPDILSQFLLAGPLIGLYGVSILIVKLCEKERKQESQ